MAFNWGGIFTDPNTQQNIWTNPTAGGLLGGVNPYQEMASLGTGILAGAQPSTTGPVTLGSAFAKGSAFAAERRDQEWMNQARRAQITQLQREMQGQQGLADYIAKGGKVDLNTMLQFMPSDTAKGIAAAYADPTLGQRTQLATEQLTEAKAKNAGVHADNDLLIQNARMARDAVAYLADKPGGPGLLASEAATGWARWAYNAGLLTKESLVAKLGQDYANVDPAEIPYMIDAAEAVHKARANVSTMAAAGSGNQGVTGLNTRLTGKAAGAGVEAQGHQFDWAVKQGETIARDTGWEVPQDDPTQFFWRARSGQPAVAATGGLQAPGVGSQNGQLVTQPQSVYGDPAAAPPITPSEPLPQAAPDATVQSPGDIPYLGPAMRAISGYFSDTPANPLPPPGAAPAAAAPPARPQYLAPPSAPPVPGPTPQTVKPSIIDPTTNSPAPMFPREADAIRGTKPGQLYMLPNPGNPNDPFVYRH